MSLINEMLNKLEENKRTDDAARREALSSIRPIIRKQKGALAWKIIYWLIILVVVIGTAWYYYPLISGNLAKVTSILKKKPPTTNARALITYKTPEIKLQNILLEIKGEQTILDFILSAPTPYYLEHTSEQQLSINLGNTALSGNLPVALENSFIIALNTRQNKNDTVCTLTLLPGTKIDTLQLVEKPQPHLHLEFSNPQLTSNSKMTKVPTPISPEQQVTDRYQEIIELLVHNKIQEAMTKLHLFVGDFPNHLQARETLVSLLIKEDRLQKASEILAVGLNKISDFHPFIKLKAHILVKQNAPDTAIELLQKHLTTATDDIEYLALLAALYQQQERFIEAARLYDQLTKTQPQKSIWWFGLGSALESADKMSAAKEAYRQAYNSADVTPELMALLNNKIKE